MKNHVQDLVALDFFVVPTVTHKVLFVLLILAHERRRVVHVNVTEHPTAAWTAQQVIDAFPWDKAPRYLLRDRDRVYGVSFRQRVRHMGIKEIVIAPWSPWQNPYVERLIGSIRRECLDHIGCCTNDISHISWRATLPIITVFERIYRWPWIVQSLAQSMFRYERGAA